MNRSEQTADQFVGWRKLLALAQAHKTKLELRGAIKDAGLVLAEDDPLSGYYRIRLVKDGPLLPVAIWREAGKLIVLCNGEVAPLHRVWPMCVWTPVPYEWFEAVEDRGEMWPDDGMAQVEATAPRGIGDNAPPDEDEADTIKRQIEAATGVAEAEHKVINSDEQAAAAQTIRSRLNELAGTADKRREALKRPHLEAGREIDGKWNPLVRAAEAAAFAIRNALKVWENKKLAAEREAERQRQEAEAARAFEVQSGAQPAPLPPPAPAKPTTIKGATGRAASVRIVKVAKVTDYDAAYAHLKAIPEIKAAIDKIAQRMVDAGNSVPGVEVMEERRVA